MSKVCPVCNEIKDIRPICGNCGGSCIDNGRVQDYFGDYSENMPIQDTENYCFHVFRCECCNELVRKSVLKVDI
ncbi:hypothetical protein [Clostridium peptidivorans]|uniref:hypothetical protein n=1 Tax=Clostridium peptidivorans TaxID=100174 RepID=UPI000BE2632B|nr:hypothetical protein [Clostridium peptidivorans]